MSQWMFGQIQMQTHQCGEQDKIKTIDFNDFLDGFHNYHTITPARESIKHHPFAVKLKKHIRSRQECTDSHPQLTPLQSRRQSEQRQVTKENLNSIEHNPQLDQINIEEFVQIITLHGKQNDEERKNEMIRSLNGTWFQDVLHDEYKTSGMQNTLGIRRNKSSSRQRRELYTERGNPETLIDRHDFTKEYQQPNIFPSRKISSLKKISVKLATPRYQRKPSISKISGEGELKFQIIKSVTKPENSRVSTRQTQRTSRVSQSPNIFRTFNNDKILKASNQPVVKGVRMTIYE